eukprot:Colp12_sorted_trinity150504_noHs@17163
MSNKLFVARLPWATCKDGLKSYFSRFGAVVDSAVVMDRDTGRSRGFGFVTFEDSQVAQKVLSEQDLEIEGRKVVVSEAKERPPREMGDRPPRRDFGDRPPRDFGDRPRRNNYDFQPRGSRNDDFGGF